jgi:hypothetical protein
MEHFEIPLQKSPFAAPPLPSSSSSTGKPQLSRTAPWNVSLRVVRASKLSARVHACAVSCQQLSTSFAAVNSCCAVFGASDHLLLHLDVPSAEVACCLSAAPSTGISYAAVAVQLLGLCCACSSPCSPGSCPSVSELAIGSIRLCFDDFFAGAAQRIVAPACASFSCTAEVEFSAHMSPALPGFNGAAAPKGIPRIEDSCLYLDTAALIIRASDCRLRGQTYTGYRTAGSGGVAVMGIEAAARYFLFASGRSVREKECVISS